MIDEEVAQVVRKFIHYICKDMASQQLPIREMINVFTSEEENAQELLKLCFNKDDAKIELKNKSEILNGYIKKTGRTSAVLNQFIY